MTDYIKREDALDIVANNNVTGEITLDRYDRIIDGIYEIPSADVVSVVRCGDCKYLMENGICNIFADDHIKPSASDFCSCGERKEDETI